MTLAVQEVFPNARVVDVTTVILIVKSIAWSPDLRTWMPEVSTGSSLIIIAVVSIIVVVVSIIVGIVYCVRLRTQERIIYVKIDHSPKKGE
jgi:hypothetical protein